MPVGALENLESANFLDLVPVQDLEARIRKHDTAPALSMCAHRAGGRISSLFAVGDRTGRRLQRAAVGWR
jgi:hypothetical protein